MAHLIVQHRVENFGLWKPKYDSHASVRKQSGCINEQLFRSSDDPNYVTIVFEWDSLENARKFAQSSNLAETMRDAGVIGGPKFQFLQQVEKKETGQKIKAAA